MNVWKLQIVVVYALGTVSAAVALIWERIIINLT